MASEAGERLVSPQLTQWKGSLSSIHIKRISFSNIKLCGEVHMCHVKILSVKFTNLLVKNGELMGGPSWKKKPNTSS